MYDNSGHFLSLLLGLYVFYAVFYSLGQKEQELILQRKNYKLSLLPEIDFSAHLITSNKNAGMNYDFS